MVFLGRVLIYSLPSCPFCKRAKKLLSDIQVPFVDVNLEKYPERRYDMQERTGRRTVPQIFFNAKHIGGFDELKKLYDEDKLDDLLKEVASEEAPPSAPSPPPEDHDDSDGDTELLPSQRNIDETCVECTPDELAGLVREIRDNSGIIGSHTYHFVNYKNTFVGRDLVTWLVQNKSYKTREEAVLLCQELFKGHFFHHVTFDHEFRDEKLFYRLLGDGHMRALNAQLSYACIPRPAIEVAEDLRKYILEIYSEYLSPDGLAVDYRGISQSRKFETYVRATAELKRVDLSTLTKNEKLAFFINIYNALVVHAFVVQGPPTSMWKRFKFFNQISYIIGGRVFSLNDIESGVVRANRKPIGALKRPFSRDDPRLKIALKEPEPRIHFALVCGAKSCPPIKTYSAQNVDEELSVAAEAFFEGDEYLTIDVPKREVTLSMILKWYKIDFGSNNQELVRWVVDHMADGLKKQQLRDLLKEGNVKVKFRSYNWDLNSA